MISSNDMEANLQVHSASCFLDLYKSFTLVHDRYLEYGLGAEAPSGLRFFTRNLLPHATCFVAFVDRDLVGTATAIVDSGIGLPSGNLYQNEIFQLTSANRRIMESTQYACSSSTKTRGAKLAGRSVVAARLLHILYQWSVHSSVDDWLIVVHPNHAEYYIEKLGFELSGEKKACKHVKGKPGVLLRLKVRELAAGIVEHTDEGKIIFLSSAPECVLSLKKRVWLDEEVASLYALDPLQFKQNMSKVEETRLQECFPTFVRHLNDFSRGGKSFSPVTREIGRCFVDMLYRSEAEDLRHYGRFVSFSLREELNRLELPLSLRASRLLMNFRVLVESSVPNRVILDLMSLHELLGTLVNVAINSGVPYSSIRLLATAEPISPEGFSLVFHLSGANMAVPGKCRKLAPKLGGFMRVHNMLSSDPTVEFQVPALLFTDIESGTSVDHEQRLEHFQYLRERLQGGRKRVLVHERNQIDREIVGRALERHGHSVVIVDSPSSTVNLCRNETFDVVVVNDDEFPGSRKMQSLCGELRMLFREVGRGTRIVGIGDKWAEQRNDLKIPVDAIVAKPIKAHDLIACL